MPTCSLNLNSNTAMNILSTKRIQIQASHYTCIMYRCLHILKSLTLLLVFYDPIIKISFTQYNNMHINIEYIREDWSACGNLDTEFWRLVSLDFIILRPSVNRISCPFKNFSIWRSTLITLCLSMQPWDINNHINIIRQQIIYRLPFASKPIP